MSRALIKEVPLVTVITVTYNSSAYVRDAIESVLAQTYANIEYIVGDDCSTDNTWQIIQEYKDARIKKYRNEINLREYSNRNKAIEQATGKYLIFIDGDDVIYPHGIAYFVSQMEAYPSAAMAIQKNYINNILFPALIYPKDLIVNHFFGKTNLLSSSFASDFFKTNIIKRFTLKTEVKAGDDEIRLRIAAQYPTLFIQGWVSWPRETPGQAALQITDRDRLTEAYLNTIPILREMNADETLKQAITKILMRRLARFCLKQLFSGKIRNVTHILHHTGISFFSLVKFWNYRPMIKDPIDEFTPQRPLKKHFLNKSHESIS
jgi:glycosyltransferase involved in cell wall biosynthesis